MNQAVLPVLALIAAAVFWLAWRRRRERRAGAPAEGKGMRAIASRRNEADRST